MIHRTLDAIRRWWHTGHGRHTLTPGDDFDFTDDLTRQTIPRKPVNGRPPWQTAPQPTICLYPPAARHRSEDRRAAGPAPSELAPGPDLPPAGEWAAEAELRANSPHLFVPDADYWATAWSKFRDFCDEWLALDEALANTHRAECGLPPRPVSLPAAA